MNYEKNWLSPYVNGFQNSWTSQPQGSQIVPAEGPVTGLPITELTAGEWESDLGIGNTVPTQTWTNLKQWEFLQGPPFSEPINNQQISDHSQYNPEIQNTDASDDLALVMEVCQRSDGQNDSNLFNEISEASRSPNIYRHNENVFYPIQHDLAEMTRRRHSSGFSVYSRCGTPFGPGSAGSSPRSESFELNNVERAPISYQDPLTFCGSHLPQSVPELFGVHSNSDNSTPAQINNDPPPPYHYPHIKDISSSIVQIRAPPSYPTFNRNKVQACNSLPQVKEIAATSHVTETEKLIRMFGRPPQCVGSYSSAVDKRTHLWQFLLQLLGDKRNSHIICWEGSNGEFRFVKPEEVAARWGQTKGKNKMNYDSLSRALRYYYDRKMLIKNRSKKFVYQFLIEGILSELRTPRISDPEFIQQSSE